MAYLYSQNNTDQDSCDASSDNQSDTGDDGLDTDSDCHGIGADKKDSGSGSATLGAGGSDDLTLSFESWLAGANKPTVTWSSARLKSASPPAPSRSPSPSPAPKPFPSSTRSPSLSATVAVGAGSTLNQKRKPRLDFEQEKKRKRPRVVLPIEKDQAIVQYTVFRTRQMAQRPVSGDQPDRGPDSGARIVRVASFVDKHRANQHAARILRGLWTPSARRAELDCNDNNPSRNGMFSGSIELASGVAVSVYVDRETVSFAETELADSDSSNEEDEDEDAGDRDDDTDSGNTLRKDYEALLLRPRYDVFVFVQKPLDDKDGHYVMHIYDEDDSVTRGYAEGSEDDDDDSSSDSSSSESEGTTEDRSRKQKKKEEKQEAALPPSPVSSTSPPSPSSPPPTPPPVTHWVPHHEGSFTTLATAYRRLVDAFATWTRPPEPPRLDAVVYYRDVLRPYIAELSQHPVALEEEEGDADQADSADGTAVEIQWTPVPQLRYAYETIAATVVKSRLQGPLDLTGAFGGERRS